MIGAEHLLRPGLWPLLLLAPAVLAALLLAGRVRARRRAALLGPRADRLAPGAAARHGTGRALLLAGGILAAAAALLEPVGGPGAGEPVPRGMDVVVALDVSRSMLARDEVPDRLGRARREIAALAGEARGDRLGLVVFAGEARLLVPLTEDLDTLAALAATADPLSVRRGGTDLGAALDAARAALDAASEEGGAVILLTDGEDLSGSGLRAAAACRESGIAVHAVALGGTRGTKIPVPGEGGEAFLRDGAGREIVSVPDRESLRRLAEAGGGSFTDGTGTPEALVALHRRHLLPAARAARADSLRRDRAPLFPIPVLCAVLLWSLAWCPPSTPRS